jgi:hypothetical protein
MASRGYVNVDDIEVPIDDCEAYTSYITRNLINNWITSHTMTVVPKDEEPEEPDEDDLLGLGVA